jgi:hypothetical protein
MGIAEDAERARIGQALLHDDDVAMPEPKLNTLIPSFSAASWLANTAEIVWNASPNWMPRSSSRLATICGYFAIHAHFQTRKAALAASLCAAPYICPQPLYHCSSILLFYTLLALHVNSPEETFHYVEYGLLAFLFYRALFFSYSRICDLGTSFSFFVLHWNNSVFL